MSAPSPSPSPGLTRIARYDRNVAASLERVWENVRDWEHLPWLHASSFASIECFASGREGWRARVELPRREGRRRENVIELSIQDERRYVTRTLEGSGAGTEIWTSVDFVAENDTRIEVEFWLPAVSDERRESLAAGYRRLYAQLWDEDEAMMVEREQAVRARRAAEGVPELELGALAELRPRLPLDVSLAGLPYRLAEVDGELVAWSRHCPHWLGPLEAPADGRVRCPWHGYTFDLRSGRECAGRKPTLAHAHVTVDPSDGRVRLRAGAGRHG